MNNPVIALIGNPNSGKTTLFNGLTGGKFRTGNWPGVTVEKREGILRHETIHAIVVDLPGIYSFSAQSEDEKIARNYALSGEPSLILNIIDAANLERNLYLTTQLIEMKVPVLIAVNMCDIAEKNKIKINIAELSKKIGLPVIGISAVESQDIVRIKNEIMKQIAEPRITGVEVKYPNEIESIVASWHKKTEHTAQILTLDARWIALKLLEDDTWIKEKVLADGRITAQEINSAQQSVEKILGDTPDIICADYRYGFIHGISQSVVKRTASRRSFTDKADKIILNRMLGIPVFLLVMYLVFWTTITVSGAFIDFFDIFFGTIFVDGFGALLGKIGIPAWLTLVLADGIGGGIQRVATFIPVIFMMFFMLSLLEDSGYMARAAFVMDGFTKFLGLPGKAFVPLLVGFGCTVPAILGARTLENKKDRFLTIFMAPFMSCGARLPVYALFTAAFFPKNSGIIVFSIYLAGIVLAVLTGLLLKHTLFRGEPSYFIMELPPYHLPRIRHILLHTWERLKGFIFRAGKVIITAVLILSLLNSLGTDGSIGNEDREESVLAAIGKTITPVFTPMGIEKENWPATVALFTGIFAKEAIVGTLNSLYEQIASSEKADVISETGNSAGTAGYTAHTENKEDSNSKLRGNDEKFSFWRGIGSAFRTIPEGLAGIFDSILDPLGIRVIREEDTAVLAQKIGTDAQIFGTMHRHFTRGKPQAYAYLLFILLYFPCIAAFAAIVRETGAVFGILNALYLTLLAWVTATLFYQITTAHNPVWIIIPFAVLGSIAAGLILLKNNAVTRSALSLEK